MGFVLLGFVCACPVTKVEHVKTRSQEVAQLIVLLGVLGMESACKTVPVPVILVIRVMIARLRLWVLLLSLKLATLFNLSPMLMHIVTNTSTPSVFDRTLHLFFHWMPHLNQPQAVLAGVSVVPQPRQTRLSAVVMAHL